MTWTVHKQPRRVVVICMENLYELSAKIIIIFGLELFFFRCKWKQSDDPNF